MLNWFNKKFKVSSKETEQNIQTPSNAWYSWMYWGAEATTEINQPTSSKGWIQRYNSMVENDTITRAFVMVLQLLMTTLYFHIQERDKAEDSEERIETANEMFIKWSGGDFKSFLQNYVSTFIFGFSVFEVILKKGETGYELENLVFHPQKYLTAKFKDSYELEGFDSQLTTETIPISQCVYAQGLGNFDHNVYGQSVLRAGYFHFKNKCFYLVKENRQAQINLEGVPVLRVDNTGSDAENKKNLERATAQALAYKNGQSYGLILGSKLHKDIDGKNSNMYTEDVKLMSVEGSKFIDTNELVKREENAIARSLMAEFLVMVGQDSGSYALGKETTSMFKLLVEGIAQHLCDTFNHQIIKPLWVLNGGELDDAPELTYDSVDLTLEGMATFINALSSAGIVLTPSQENYLFEYGGLPKPTKEENLEQAQQALMMNPMNPQGSNEPAPNEPLDEEQD
jgi:phage gp29-like protein